MDPRNAILSKVRAKMGYAAGRDATVAARLAEHRRGLIPARGQLPDVEARIALFAEMVTRASATLFRLPDANGIGPAVADYLRARNLAPSIRVGSDPRLADIALPETVERRSGASDGSDLVALSHAFGGIAETGTLALLSGPENPVTLSFLPEHHIVVLRAEDIAGDMETVFDRLRQATGGAMPRTLNFISGPSRSADIEQTIILGAHGPRALHILVIG